MKRRIAVLLIFISCAAPFLSAGKPRLIGEEKAKEAGLAFINQVFGANETEATVTYRTHAGISYIDGEYVETGDEQPAYFYVVSASERKDGQYGYYAQVNAETGVAYRAAKSSSLLPDMTAEQRKAANAAYRDGDWINYDFTTVDVDCRDFAREWVTQTFHPKAPILGFIDCGYLSDESLSPGVKTNFYVVIRDGTTYYIDMAWPQLTVLEVGILNQIRPYMDEP